MSVLMTLCKFAHFSGAEDSNKQIADRILLHLRDMEKASAQEVADFCYVSVATVSRFIRSMGFPSFAQFKQALEHELNQYGFLTLSGIAPSSDLNTAMENYIEQSVTMVHKLRNDLDRDMLVAIADAMYESRELFVFSFFLPSSLPYLRVDLGLFGKGCQICETEVDQRRTLGELGPDSLLLAIKAQDADCRYMDALIRQAKAQGAKVALILNTENAGILDSADYPLCFSGTNSPVDSAVINDCITLLSIAYRKKYLNL